MCIHALQLGKALRERVFIVTMAMGHGSDTHKVEAGLTALCDLLAFGTRLDSARYAMPSAVALRATFRKVCKHKTHWQFLQ